MGTPHWHDFLTALVGFAGTLFAVILAIRPLTSHRLSRQHRAAGDRLEAGSVTFELAVATLCALAYLAPDQSVRKVLIVIATTAGVVLIATRIVVHLQEYRRWRQAHGRAERIDGSHILFKAKDHWSVAGHGLPFSCYVILAASQVFELPATLTAFAMIWLVISGTAQAVFWFLNTWKESVSEGSLDRAGKPAKS